MSNNLFGDVLRKLIRENGLTQRELAKMLYVTESTMSNYVNNRTLPSYETCVYIGMFFGVTVDYLLGRESKESRLCELNNDEYMIIELLRDYDVYTRREAIRKLIYFLRLKDKGKDS